MAYGGSTGQKEFISADILTKNVEVDEFTFTVSGEGLFDRLMETATKHLQVQFDANRIRQEDYAQAYIDIYKATLQAALQAWDTTLKDDENEAKLALLKAQTAQYEYQTEHLLPKQVEELTAKIANIEAQTATEDKKPALVEEQTKQIIEQAKESQAKQGLTKRQAMAYNDEFRQKMFKIMMDSWSVGFSAGSDSKEITVPGVITTPAINEFYSQMRSYIMDLSADTLKWSNNNNGAGDVVTASNPVSGKQLTRGVIVNNSDTLSGFRPDFVDNGGKTPADQLPSDQEDGSKIAGRVTYPKLSS